MSPAVSNRRNQTSSTKRPAVTSVADDDSPPPPQKRVKRSTKKIDVPSENHDDRSMISTKSELGLGLPEQLVGREREIDFLTNAIDTLIRDGTSGSFYLSGQPGTGKTVTVSHCIRTLQKERKRKFDFGYVNCMGVRTPGDIYRLVLDSLAEDDEKKKAERGRVPTVEQLADTVRERFEGSRRATVLVLDEIDQLATRDHKVLYVAFGWPSLKSSRLILIGIANSLDLTERLLPKLKLADPPRLLQFRPYSKDEVIAILKHRLSEADSQLGQAGFELCARKVSARTGDIREALEICQTAIAKNQRRRKVEGGEGQQGVFSRDVLETVKDKYGSVMSRANVALPLQQKLVLATCVALSRTGIKSPSLAQLFRAYKKACDAQHVLPVQENEAKVVCQLLEAHGLLKVCERTRKSSSSPATVQLLVDEQSVMNALNDQTLFASVLSTIC